MQFNNPLIFSILSVLKDANKPLSLYQLIKILEDQGYDLINAALDGVTENSEANQLNLFRKNFIVMNALYQLKLDFSDTGIKLFVSSLNIFLVTEINSEFNDLSIEVNDLSIEVNEEADQALSDYYLDWNNFNNTGKDEVDALLKSFWRSFNQYNKLSHECDKRLDSLQVLGLESKASWKDIQQTYRKLVTVYHPDKGGNSLKFIKIREAYLILKLTYKLSH
jgi:DnaJ-like protein